jgi:hypothetical protein
MGDLTEYFSTKAYSPRAPGWYQCNQAQGGTWTYFNGAFCYWDGKEWFRACGWPSQGRIRLFQLLNGILNVCDDALFKAVEVNEFRGLVQQSHSNDWAIPSDRIFPPRD